MIGYKKIIQSGVCWRKNQKGVLLLSPPSRLKGFDRHKAKLLLKKSGELFVRWETDFDNIEDSCWWHIIKDKPLMFDGLSKNTRYKVRRGAKSFKCETVPRDGIISLGYDVYKKAITRYETHEKEYSKSKFIEMVASLPEETEFWGVWNKSTNELVAFSENYVEDRTCCFISIWFDPLSLKEYSANVLFFEMISHYFDKRKIRYVSNGTRNLSHDTNIHDFLISKFGFRKAYAKLNVEYVFWLRILVGVLYPFHLWISKVPLKPFQKVSILLSQEKIRRACA